MPMSESMGKNAVREVTESKNGELAKVAEAASALKVSRSYLHKLPKDTPGVYRFGRSVRFSIEELKAWGRERDAG